MIEYKNFLKNKLKEKKDLKETDRLQILPNGDNWRKYFDNQVLTDNEYIVYYNINNIIYLYDKTNDLIDIVGDLDDLVDPIDNTSIVNAINYVYQNGSGNIPANTSDIDATIADDEGGETQYEININNKNSIDTLNTEVNDILNNGVPSGNTSVIETASPETEGGITQQEVNETNKEAIDTINSDISDINSEIENITNGTTPVITDTDSINTIDSELEGGTTQEDVNINNKSSIDNLTSEINGIINGTTPVITATDSVNTIDSELEGGETQQEVNQNHQQNLDTINTEIDTINQEITDINNNLPDLTNYYTKSEVDNMISDLQSQINNCCGTTTPTGDITNLNVLDPTEIDGNGSVSFDSNVNDCSGTSVARLNPTAGTNDLPLTNGSNVGLEFTNLPVGDYTIQIYCDETLLASQSFTINPYLPPTNGLIPLTPEEDDENSKSDGEIIDDYTNYDIIISKNNHTDYVSNGLFIGKEIVIDDLNQSGIIDGNEISKLAFSTATEFNLTETGDYDGIFYLKGINVGLTPLITAGQYHNNDTFTWLDAITNYNMIIQKWSDETRDVKTYTFWEIDTSVGNSYIYAAKNAAETGLNGWIYNNLKIETGIGENSYLEMIYGFNFTEITNLVISSTGSTFTISDYTGYDLLLFNVEQSGNNSSTTWFININDLIQDGTTKYSYGNYNDNYFTISNNVITWNAESGIGHLNLVGIKGIKI